MIKLSFDLYTRCIDSAKIKVSKDKKTVEYKNFLSIFIISKDI